MTKQLIATALAAVLCMATVYAADEDKADNMEKTVTTHVHKTHKHVEKRVANKADAEEAAEEAKEARKEKAKEEAREEKAEEAGEVKKAAHHPKKHHRHHKKWGHHHHHGCMGDMNGTMKMEKCYLPGMIKENMADGVVGQEASKMSCEGKMGCKSGCKSAKMDCHTKVANDAGESWAWIWMPKGSCDKIEGASVVDRADVAAY